MGVTAAGFALSAILVALAVAPALRVVPVAEGAVEVGVTYRRQFAQGWDFLHREPVLLAIAIMVAMTNCLEAAWATMFAPAWALAHGYGADRVGLLFATLTGGAIIGSLIAAAVGHRMPRLPVYVIAFTIAGLPRYAALAADLPFVTLLAILAVSGLASGLLNPLIAAVQFERIPKQLVGRVSSLVAALAWGLMPFGGLLGAALIDHLGLTSALLGVGVAYLLATLSPLAVPAFRRIGNRQPEPVATSD